MRDKLDVFDILLKEKNSMCRIAMWVLVSSLLEFVVPFQIQRLVDNGIIIGNMSTVIICAFSLVLLYILITCIEMIKENRRLHLYKEVKRKYELEVYEKLMRIEISYFKNTNLTANYKLLQDDIDSICSIIDEDTFNIFTGLISAITGIIALMFISKKLTAILAVVVIAEIALTAFFSSKFVKLSEIYRNSVRSFSTTFAEIIAGLHEIRVFSLSSLFRNRISYDSKCLFDATGELSKTNKLSQQLQILCVDMLNVTILLISGILIISEDFSIGSMTAFQTYALLVINPLVSGATMVGSAFQLAPSIRHLHEFLNYKEEQTGKSKIKDIKTLVFHDVDFSYGEDFVFRNVSFEMNAGSKVVIIGANGVGKSTLINLILRFYVPINGYISINGRNITDYQIDDYRRQFGVVSQDIFLFNTTIEDNICMGRVISQDALMQICKTVGLDATIKKLGLKGDVGNNGAYLSGGTRQKIALARALICEKPFLIFDESESNLDNKTISEYRDYLKRLPDTITVLYITHNETDYSMFDYILEIKNDKINWREVK